ncbi:hypothetical protein AB835_03630 [Candidatus Endobugula sertula]|uniref:Recombinase XerD n=1 Tax=Candidatus Endobugula sertula TaxID=62101 RepID=A0A1D2QS51_9GAMM|nr:hypothetical protein AB835_03630 [Candidatus Endobugula sertula]
MDTIKRRDSALRRFIEWCDDRGLDDPTAITKPILERYQRYLYHYRKDNGEPLSIGSQNVMLTPVKSFFKWLTQENYLLYNPASELVLPKKPKGLPRNILSVEEVIHILSQPDTTTLEGVRDRAILEVFYATGIRRSELIHLKEYEIDHSRQTVFVKEGKYHKDRYLPLGKRALQWIQKYQREVRDHLLIDHQEPHVFLTDYGEPFNGSYIGHQVKKYIEQAGIKVSGSCHLFRHAMATHMLENGADIRFIQAMLGHADLSTTEIYTRVSIEKLREIHAATHPAKITADERVID